MQNTSRIHFKISFGRDEYYYKELLSHLATLKSGKEMSLAIKKVLFSKSKLDHHEKFPKDEIELPENISFLISFSEKDYALAAIREKLLTSPRQKWAEIIKQLVFEVYAKDISEVDISENLTTQSKESSLISNATIATEKPPEFNLQDNKMHSTSCINYRIPGYLQRKNSIMKQKIISIDVGYGNTKAVWDYGLEKTNNNRWGEACFPSIVLADYLNTGKRGGNFSDGGILMDVNGKKYYAGPGVPIGIERRVLNHHYIESDGYEAMIRASLYLMMKEKNQIIETIDMMVLGLPVSSLFKSSKKLMEIALRPREVPVPIFLQKNGNPATVVVQATKALVLPQPFGSLRYVAKDLSFDDEFFSERASSMVIDPGYWKFNWLVSNGFNPEMQLSGSFDGGISSVFRQVGQKIAFDYGIGSLEFNQIEEGLIRGNIDLGYQVIDTKPYRSTALDAVRNEVGAFLARIDLNKSKLSRVFLTGGGAEFYAEALQEKLPGYRIEMLKDSVMANARGHWIAGCLDLGIEIDRYSTSSSDGSF